MSVTSFRIAAKGCQPGRAGSDIRLEQVENATKGRIGLIRTRGHEMDATVRRDNVFGFVAFLQAQPVRTEAGMMV